MPYRMELSPFSRTARSHCRPLFFFLCRRSMNFSPRKTVFFPKPLTPETAAWFIFPLWGNWPLSLWIVTAHLRSFQKGARRSSPPQVTGNCRNGLSTRPTQMLPTSSGKRDTPFGNSHDGGFSRRRPPPANVLTWIE